MVRIFLNGNLNNYTRVTLNLSALRKIVPTGSISQSLPIVREWCNNHPSDKNYWSSAHTFYFEDPNDAAFFALRWC